MPHYLFVNLDGLYVVVVKSFFTVSVGNDGKTFYAGKIGVFFYNPTLYDLYFSSLSNISMLLNRSYTGSNIISFTGI